MKCKFISLALRIKRMDKALKRHFLKESEIKQILGDFRGKIYIDFEEKLGAKPRIELVKTQEIKIFIFGKTPFLAGIRGHLFPTLLFEDIFPLLPKIVVDMGAIPHICNGADIMAPGVIKIDGEFGKDSFILIIDERYRKPIAIGEALLDSETMKATKRGRIVKNVHHVGDEVWSLMRKLT